MLFLFTSYGANSNSQMQDMNFYENTVSLHKDNQDLDLLKLNHDYIKQQSLAVRHVYWL